MQLQLNDMYELTVLWCWSFTTQWQAHSCSLCISSSVPGIQVIDPLSRRLPVLKNITHWRVNHWDHCKPRGELWDFYTMQVKELLMYNLIKSNSWSRSWRNRFCTFTTFTLEPPRLLHPSKCSKILGVVHLDHFVTKPLCGTFVAACRTSSRWLQWILYEPNKASQRHMQLYQKKAGEICWGKQTSERAA